MERTPSAHEPTTARPSSHLHQADLEAARSAAAPDQLHVLSDAPAQEGRSSARAVARAPRLGVAARAATAAAHGTKAPFTLRGAKFSVRDHRLTYTLTICTPVKSVLALRAKFAPTKQTRGVITLTPGTTQYQDHGCWPAFVSVPLARTETKHCKPIDCPAILRHRYRSTVTITYAHPREVRRAPRLQAVA